jgi:hypothetical protein
MLEKGHAYSTVEEIMGVLEFSKRNVLENSVKRSSKRMIKS